MPDKTWKAKERQVGELFGVRRRRGSGCDPETGGDDIVHPRLFVEVKLRKKMAAVTMWENEAVPPAKEEGKLPVLVVFGKGNGTPFLVAPLDKEYLEAILKEMKGTDGPKPDMQSLFPPQLCDKCLSPR
ncbi:hypothetical protein [uncultured Mediterranean phage]|nr:hypothetical protein [uncultured Mediterranean phage]